MRVLKVPRKMCIKPLLRDRNAVHRFLATFAFALGSLGCGGGGGGRCLAHPFAEFVKTGRRDEDPS